VQDRVILNIRAPPDTDGLDVGTKNRIKPDAGFVADIDITNDMGAGSNPHSTTQARFLPEVTLEPGAQSDGLFHWQKLAPTAVECLRDAITG
jgi:hypothetical protein